VSSSRIDDDVRCGVARVRRLVEPRLGLGLDDLRREGIQRYLERYDHLLDVPGIGEHALARRITTLVEARQRFYETIDPMARLARAQALTVPELDDALGRVRATLADQLSEHFAVELGHLRPARRRELVAVVAALTSYETWEQLRRQGLDRAAVGRAMRLGVERLLVPTGSITRR
jgi:hypothetical protein